MNTSIQSNGRVAVLTGAAGGLGEAFAYRLAACGYRLVLTDRQPCDALASQVRDACDHVDTIACDLADTGGVEQFTAEVLDRVGRVDVLVNNAAFMPQIPLEAMTATLWRQIMTINVDAPFLLAKGFSVGMASRRWGRIINLASSTIWGPPAGLSAYACSKMGVIGLTRALAAELGRHGITVNAISPGLTRHAGSAANIAAEAFEGVRTRQFIPRTELPDDLTGALAFLASEDSRFITGQVLNVDGGGFGF
jgi:3-oxoacyl-[acyl-carrier protein] reductase/(S)-1-phenylethanol dehydrogenase